MSKLLSGTVMPCTSAELEQLKRFATVYERAMTPAMKAIERKVCGCDYGGNSWLSLEQANDLGARLGLGPQIRLLDLGAGSGWPAIYLVKTFGCKATLVDLPEVGLRIAEERAAADGCADKIQTLVADAAELPFSRESFDAISHSDLLCCLKQKREALENCRRVVRRSGRMVFTVISISRGLSAADHRRAAVTSPEFVETDTSYDRLLQDTDWSIDECVDITREYEASCRRQIEADQENEDQLIDLIGRDEFVERLAGWRAKLSTIEDGLVIRQLYIVTPGS